MITGFQVHYKFTRVFGETTSQKHLFDCVGAPLIDDLVRGKNGELFVLLLYSVCITKV